MYKCESGKEKLKVRYAFLFSSAVIVCKPRGPFYTFKSTVELDEGYEVSDVPFWTLPKDEQNGKYAYAWALKKKTGKGEVCHVFAAKTLLNRKKWMGLMETSIETLRDKKSGPPEAAPRGPSSAGAGGAPPIIALPAPAVSDRPRPGTAGSPAAPAATQTKSKGYEKWVIGPPPPGAGAGGGDAGGPSSLKRQGSVSGTASGDSAWFAGKLPRDKAEKILTPLRAGTYLVRESDNRLGDYSLSIKYGQVKHIKINRTGNKYELAPDAKAFPTIQELVEHFQVCMCPTPCEPGLAAGAHAPLVVPRCSLAP